MDKSVQIIVRINLLELINSNIYCFEWRNRNLYQYQHKLKQNQLFTKAYPEIAMLTLRAHSHHAKEKAKAKKIKETSG